MLCCEKYFLKKTISESRSIETEDHMQETSEENYTKLNFSNYQGSVLKTRSECLQF